MSPIHGDLLPNGNCTDEDYRPQNVLVTGGAGFIASHVVLRLVQHYAHYKVLCELFILKFIFK